MYRNREHENMLLILYVLISITGIGYFIVAAKSGTLSLWAYSDDIVSSGGSIPKIINYGKDIFLVLCTMKLFFQDNPIPLMRREWFYAISIVVVGTCMDMVNGNGVLCAIGGIRAYLYAFSVFIICKDQQFESAFYRKLIRISNLLLTSQLLAVLMQAGLTNGAAIGSGAYRMMGLFTNGGTLGSFAIGTAILYSYAFIKYDFIGKFQYIFAFIVIAFLALASGGRGAVLFSICFLLIGLITGLKEIGVKARILLVPSILVCAMVAVIDKLTTYIGRGDIMVSGQGRIRAWQDLFEMNIIDLLIGQGLGVGTNTARSMGYTSVTMDSTVTVLIVQFGIIGLLLVSILYFLFATNMLQKKDTLLWYRIWIVVFVMVMLLSGSLFEQYVMIVPLIIVCADIIIAPQE